MSPPSAAWHPDPSGRHQWRWWDGAAWTAHVADDGEAALDGVAGEAGDVAADDATAGEAAAGDCAADDCAAGDAAVGDAAGTDPVRDGAAVRFRPGIAVLLVRRDDGPRGTATAGAVVAGAPAAAGGGEPAGGPTGEVLAAVEVPAAVPPLGRSVPDAVAGSRVIVRDAGGAVLLTVTRPDARPTVVVGPAPAGTPVAAGPGPEGFTAEREVDGRRWSIVFRCGGEVCGRMDREDLLGRQWLLADTEPRATVQRRIGRPADRRRWAAVEYEVRSAGPPPPPGVPARTALDATLWVVGAVLALDLLDTQLPDRDD